MKKAYTYICLLLLICFTHANDTEKESSTEEYSKMSTTQLKKALITAVEENAPNTVKKLILAGANVNQTITYTEDLYDWDGVKSTCSVLEYASQNGYVAIVKELINAKPTIDSINQALIAATEKGHADVVQELVKYAHKKFRDRALIEAAKHFPGIKRYTAEDKRTLKNYLEVIRLLIQASVDVNYIDNCGNTPLITMGLAQEVIEI